MSRSEVAELPEELRKIFLVYVRRLDKTISTLLHSSDEIEFERNFDKVISEFSRYLYGAELTLDEDYIHVLLERYLKTSHRPTHAQTPLSQTLANATEVIINFIRIAIEPNYLTYVLKHPDVFIPYMELPVLVYILSNIPETVDRSIVDKVIQRCQETTSDVECYIDTIEIDADSEARAALQRIKQTSF